MKMSFVRFSYWLRQTHSFEVALIDDDSLDAFLQGVVVELVILVRKKSWVHIQTCVSFDWHQGNNKVLYCL